MTEIGKRLKPFISCLSIILQFVNLCGTSMGSATTLQNNADTCQGQADRTRTAVDVVIHRDSTRLDDPRLGQGTSAGHHEVESLNGIKWEDTTHKLRSRV